MAITLDTTVKGASANSYNEIAEVDAYAETTAWFATWTALTDAQKDELAVRATRSLDTMAHTGYQTDSDQALQYPRLNQYKKSGVAWASDAIPKPIKDAHAHLAAYLSSLGVTVEPFAPSTSRNVKREKFVDVIGEKEYWGQNANDGDTFLADIIEPLLAPHGLIGAAGTVLLTR